MLSRAGKARGRDARAWASGRGRRRQESTEGADSGREVAGARPSRGRPLWRRQAREASRVARLPGPERGVSEGQPSGPGCRAQGRASVAWPGREAGRRLLLRGTWESGLVRLEPHPDSSSFQGKCSHRLPWEPEPERRQGGLGTVAGCSSNDRGLFNWFPL